MTMKKYSFTKSFSYSFIILQIIILSYNKILCLQLKITLTNQIYQFPINLNLYRLRNLMRLTDSEIEIPSKTLSLPLISISIGNPPQNLSLIYSTGKHLTWVHRNNSNNERINQKYFDAEKSSTKIFCNELYEFNTYTFGALSNTIQDFITLNSFNNKNLSLSVFLKFMHVYYLSPNNLYADGELGLARQYLGIYADPYITKNTTDFSLIENLYKNNLTKDKTFSHKWISDKEGILYIGEYPLLSYQKKYYDFHRCKTYSSSGEIIQYWNCYISGVKIGNSQIYYHNSNKSTYKQIGMFSTGEKFIFIPEEHRYIINLINNYTKWSRKNCNLDEYTSYKELHCNYSTFKYSYFPSVYFNFSGYEIKLKPEDIFYYNNNKKYYRLLIVLYNKKDYWIFGSLLTNKNNMIFEDDGNLVFFKLKKLLSPASLTKILFYALLIFCSFGTIFSLVLYFKGFGNLLSNVDINIKRNYKLLT